MLNDTLSGYDKKELVYIPYGAEKGDCPFCSAGVLRRDYRIEEIYKSREGYICPVCGTIFSELCNRLFRRIAVNRSQKLRRG